MTTKPDMKQISLIIPADIARRLKIIKRETGISITRQITDVLRTYTDNRLRDTQPDTPSSPYDVCEAHEQP